MRPLLFIALLVFGCQHQPKLKHKIQCKASIIHDGRIIWVENPNVEDFGVFTRYSSSVYYPDRSMDGNELTVYFLRKGDTTYYSNYLEFSCYSTNTHGE